MTDFSGDGLRIGADNTGRNGIDIDNLMAFGIDDDDAGRDGVQNPAESRPALPQFFGDPRVPRSATVTIFNRRRRRAFFKSRPSFLSPLITESAGLCFI